MRKVSCLMATFLAFSSVACERQGQGAQADDAKPRPAAKLPDLKPGVHQQELKYDNGTLRYTISIPKDGAKKSAAPLIIALHYGGEVTPFYGRGMIDSLVGPASRSIRHSRLRSLHSYYSARWRGFPGCCAPRQNHSGWLRLFSASALASFHGNSNTDSTAATAPSCGSWSLEPLTVGQAC